MKMMIVTKKKRRRKRKTKKIRRKRRRKIGQIRQTFQKIPSFQKKMKKAIMNSSSNKTLISIKAKIPGKIIKMDFNQGIEALNMTKKMKEEAEGEGEEEEEEEEVMMGMEEEEMTMEEEGEEVEILRTIENHGMTTKTMKDFLKSREQNCFLMTT